MYEKNAAILEITASKDGLTVSGDGDGIRIQSLPGTLDFPLRKYATGMNETLKSITWNADGKDTELIYNGDGLYEVDSPNDKLAMPADTQNCVYIQNGTGWKDGIMAGMDLSSKDLSGIFAKEVTVEVTDTYHDAILTINKEINEMYQPFGNATFLFRITGSGIAKAAFITIPEGQTKGSVKVILPYGADYRIEEIPVARYRAWSTPAAAIQHVSISEDGVITALLSESPRAEVTFYNEMTEYEKYSYTVNAINSITKGTE